MDPNIKVYKQLLSAKTCRQAIERFDRDDRVLADPQPDYSKRRYLRLVDLDDWADVADQVYAGVEVATRKYFKVPRGQEDIAPSEWADDGLVMAHYRPGDSLALHVDGQTCQPPANFYRLATLLFFLNDVANGGELEFPWQNLRIRPEMGSCVMFPPTHRYPHQVRKAKESRYILQTWIVDPRLMIVPNQ